jgi:hypothetical protein
VKTEELATEKIFLICIDKDVLVNILLFFVELGPGFKSSTMGCSGALICVGFIDSFFVFGSAITGTHCFPRRHATTNTFVCQRLVEIDFDGSFKQERLKLYQNRFNSVS